MSSPLPCIASMLHALAAQAGFDAHASAALARAAFYATCNTQIRQPIAYMAADDFTVAKLVIANSPTEFDSSEWENGITRPLGGWLAGELAAGRIPVRERWVAEIVDLARNYIAEDVLLWAEKEFWELQNRSKKPV